MGKPMCSDSGVTCTIHELDIALILEGGSWHRLDATKEGVKEERRRVAK
jgi:hypothetical protein